MATSQPVFVHSLFRSASTYFFRKFRLCGSAYTCYQEPFNESLLALNNPARQERLLALPECSTLRHPPLDRPYFYEFWERRQHLQGLFNRSFAYDEYFVDESAGLPARQVTYLSALIKYAAGRPMFQFCRSCGRVGPLRRAFGGVHVYLWREPRIQWWSYKVAQYFDSVSRLIYRCAHLPEALRRLVALVDEPGMHHLMPRDNYMMFYGLWLDSWIRVQSQADLSISLDEIGASSSANGQCAGELSELVGNTIDLSDVYARGMVFTEDENRFYIEAENGVNDIFVRSGQSAPRSVEAGVTAARYARQMHQAVAHNTAAESALRQAALTMMERLASQERAGRLGRWVSKVRRLRAGAARIPADALGLGS